jgi:membrane-associated protein
MNNLLQYLLSWLQEYGYPILGLSVFVGAVGIPLPNTLVLLAAGAFAAFGDFNFALLTTVSITAFVAGDNVSYWLGRLWGSKVLDWLEQSGRFRLIKPQTVARSRIYFARRGGWAIFFSRFLVSVLGGAINIFAGAELYPYRRFLTYDIGGETLGALLPLTLGYIFGTSWDAIGDLLGSLSIFILAFLVVLFLSYQAIGMFKRVRRLKALEQRPTLPGSIEISAISSRLSGSDPASSSSGNLPL